MTEYAEFRLKLERGTRKGTYRVEASAFGASQTGTFKPPLSDSDLENFVLKVGRTRRGVRRIESPEWDMAKVFGSKLFAALIHGPVAELYREAYAQARASKQGLRITLALTEVPEIGTIPWEYLYDDPNFLSISTRTPVVRYLDLPHPSPPLPVELPIRILGVISAPKDYPKLDTAAERAKLEAALKPLVDAGAVSVEWLEKANLHALFKRLQPDTFQILHYIGHGGFDTAGGQGALLLEDEDGHSEIVSGEQLATILYDKASLRLVFLNSCEGARNSVDDPFSGVATSLVEREIPAVIGMQFEITDRAAVLFASEFYAMLAEGQPVDAAITQARLAIFADHNDVEWATPVLFLRVADGRLFDIANAGAIARPDPETILADALHDVAIARPAPPVPTKPTQGEDHVEPIPIPIPVPVPSPTPHDQIAPPEKPEPEPPADERDAAEPETARPDTAVPDTAEPKTAEPDAAGPDTAEADAAHPDSAVPDTAGPDATAAPPTELAPGLEPSRPTSVAPVPFLGSTPPIAAPPGPESPTQPVPVPTPAPPLPPTTVDTGPGSEGIGSEDAALPGGHRPGTVIHDTGAGMKPGGKKPRGRWRPIAVGMAAVLVVLVAAALLLPRPSPSTGGLHIEAEPGTATVKGSGFVGGENVALGLDGVEVMTVKARDDGSFEQNVPIGNRRTFEIEAHGQSGREARTSYSFALATSPAPSNAPSRSGAPSTATPTAVPAVAPCDIDTPAPAVANPTSPGILFYTHNKGDNKTNRRLYFLTGPGATPIPLTDGTTDDTYPAWSPDHTKIVFSRGATPDGIRRLYIATFAKGAIGTPVRLTSGPKDKFPTWSANGCIAFARENEGIYKINPNRRGETPVVLDKSAGAPDWSPDGLTIAYMAGPKKNLGIFTIRPGKTRKALNLSPTEDATPKWSPDGKKIAYARGRFGTDKQDIHVVNVAPDGATSGDEQLTDTHPDSRNPVKRDCNPAWSPTGHEIVFYRGASPPGDQEYRLFTVAYPATADPPVPLTLDPPAALDPAWR